MLPHEATVCFINILCSLSLLTVSHVILPHTNSMDRVDDLLARLRGNPTLGADPSIDMRDLRAALRVADEAYYLNGEPILTDETYDTIVECYRRRRRAAAQPFDATISHAIAPDAKRSQIPLPFHLGSTTKYNIGHANLHARFQKWVTNQCVSEFVVSDKLNGASVVYSHQPEGYVLQTHSGWCIDYMIPFLRLAPLPVGHAVRGELIMPSDTFDAHFKQTYENALAAVTGQLAANPSSVKPALVRQCRFVVFEYIDNGDDKQGFDAKTQLAHAAAIGYEVVQHNTYPVGDVTIEWLRDHLRLRRAYSPYSIDGLVITANAHNDRSSLDHANNPTYAIAFKENPKGVLVRVNSVEWQVSRYGRLSPVITFDPIDLGTSIRRTSAKNARFVEDNCLGAGACVRIIKSGTVIPNIVEVVTGATSGHPSFPTSSYVWDSNHTFINIAADAEGPEYDAMISAQLYHFVKTCGVKHIGSKLMTRLYDAGVCTSVADIMHLTAAQLLSRNVYGVGAKVTRTLCTGISTALANIDLFTLAYASCKLSASIGRRTLLLVGKSCFHRGMSDGTLSVRDMVTIDGVGESTAAELAQSWSVFWKWFGASLSDRHRRCILENTERLLDVSGKTKKAKRKQKQKKQGRTHDDTDNDNDTDNDKKRKRETCASLDGQWVLLTGFRDPVLVEAIGEYYAKSWSNKVTMVVRKDDSIRNTKVTKATKKGVPVMTRDEFVAQYIK